MAHHRVKTWCVALLALAGSLVGGAALAQEDLGTAEQGSRAQGQEQQPIRSDGEIAAILCASNLSEIRQSKVARRMARAFEVKEFAREMIAEHTEALRNQTRLFQELRIKVQSSRMSFMISGQAKVLSQALQRQSGKTFDFAYMHAQAMTHAFTLRLIDEALIPAAKDKAVRDELMSTRKVVARHLQEATAILVRLRQRQESQGGTVGRPVQQYRPVQQGKSAPLYKAMQQFKPVQHGR